jgi:transcriptional regulator with XRE-family HTH domain
MEINYIKVGKRIKTVRESKNMTQEELAEITGLSNNYISNIECARSIPSINTLLKICNASETTPDYVLLDSVYTSKEHLMDEIALKIKKCSPKDIQFISGFITFYLENKEKKEL